MCLSRCDLPSLASSLLQSTPTAPPPPNLHRIHTMGHKRVLTPLVANPLLGSALTAPKRKRGRPRKLSGSSNGPTPGDCSMAEDENPEQEMRLHHPNRPDSPCKFNYKCYDSNCIDSYLHRSVASCLMQCCLNNLTILITSTAYL